MESAASTSALNTPIKPESAKQQPATSEGAANFLENILSESNRPVEKSLLKGEDLKSEVLRVKEEQSLSVKAISRQANVDYILLNKYLKTNQNALRSAAMYNLELKIREWLDSGDYTPSPVPLAGSPSELKVRTRITFTSKENDLVRELANKFPSKGAITNLIPALTEKWNKERQSNGLPLLHKDQVYRKFANFLAQIKVQPEVKVNISNIAPTIQSSPRKVIRFTEEEKLHIDGLLQTFVSLQELLQQVPYVTKHWNIARSAVGLDLLTEEQVKGKLERTRQSHKFTATMAHLPQFAAENASHNQSKLMQQWNSHSLLENQGTHNSSTTPSTESSSSPVVSTVVSTVASVSTNSGPSGNGDRNTVVSTHLQTSGFNSVRSPTNSLVWASGGLSESQGGTEEADLDQRTLSASPHEEPFISDKDVIDLSPGTFSESSYENMFARDEEARRDSVQVGHQTQENQASPESRDPTLRSAVVHAENVIDMEYENVDSDSQELDSAVVRNKDDRIFTNKEILPTSYPSIRCSDNITVAMAEHMEKEMDAAEADTAGSQEFLSNFQSCRNDRGTVRLFEDDSGRGSFMSCEDVEAASIRSSHSEEEATGSVSQPSKKIRDVVHYQDPESLQKMACSFMNAASSKLVRQRDQYKELWLKCRKRLTQEEMMRKKAVNDLKRQKLEYEEKLLIERNKSVALSFGAGSRQEDENQQLRNQIDQLTDELKREKQKIEGLPDMVKSFLCAHLAIENTQVVLPFIKTEKL